MTSGAVTLGDIAGRITILEIACARCERRGRLRVAKLLAEHGAGMGLPAASSPASARTSAR
jgi:hypothetical protein